MSEEEQDYWAEGCEAYDSGKEEAACPYDMDSPEGEEWMEGYYDAQYLSERREREKLLFRSDGKGE